VPWRELERQGWIAQAVCHEIRLRLPDEQRMVYALASDRDKYSVAAQNPVKTAVAGELVERHRQDNVLVIGQYLEQLEGLAAHFDAPLITGRTPPRGAEERS